MSARIVFGVHPVDEVLRRRDRKVQELLVARDEGRSSGREVRGLLELAKARGVRIQRTTREDLRALCNSASHQGVAVVVGEYPYLDLYELVERQATVDAALLLVVDGVTDPQNLGAMIRAALVLGATGVVLPKDRCAGITPAVVRVSSGATEHLPCARVTNIARSIGTLTEAGIWVAATVAEGGQDLASADLTVPLAFVLGSEQHGVRPLVLKSCDLRLTIAAAGPIGALNVASATAVCFYEAARQRRR